MKKRIFLSSPTINGSEMNYIKEAFDSNWIAPLGKNVDLLEHEIAEYLGGGYGVALSSGTAALHLAIKLAGVKEGDIVLCSTLTFAASANPIAYEKGIPVFIDCEKDTWNMDPVALEKALLKYPKAKAVVLVHLYGTPSKLDEILKICNKHKVPLIEDSAESFGAKYKGRYTGTFGDFAILSFNGNKIITTSGGGMLVSSNQEAMKRARYLATQARTPARHYQHTEIGYNYRMSNISAGIGRGQLTTLNEFIKKKKLIYHLYQILLSDIKELQMNPYDEQNSEPNYWLSCIFINKSTSVKPLDIILSLEEKNIESRPIWKPMHLQPVFADHDLIKVTPSISIAEEIFNQGVCLPSDIKNTAKDMLEIINTIRVMFNKTLICENELNNILELIGWSDNYVV